ncbi:MAG: CAP domain-containing protein [Myxococcales bacterium]|nr:CAP domain-containing protein [Myxococcales bacterium]
MRRVAAIRAWPLAWTLALTLAPVLASGTADAGSPSAPLRWSHEVGGADLALPPKDGLLGKLYARCGSRSLALDGVALALATARARGEARPAAAAIAELAQARGVAQPWPRVWSLASESPRVLEEKFDAWLERGTKAPPPGVNLRRCGLAEEIDAAGRTMITAATVDVLAELSPLPRTVRQYGWVDLSALIHADASDAKVVLLDPTGSPKRVPTSLSRGRVRSRFNLDRAGAWTIQVLATLDSGPLPVLEARIFAGVEPSDSPPQSAPAAPRSAGDHGDADALARLVARSRSGAKVPALRRDPALDVLALTHARAMRQRRQVAHDTGDGSPRDRVREAGVVHTQVGENVAHAADPAAAHRALSLSPSHRENLVFAGFRRIGIGTARDHDGTLWVTQLFAD